MPLTNPAPGQPSTRAALAVNLGGGVGAGVILLVFTALAKVIFSLSVSHALIYAALPVAIIGLAVLAWYVIRQATRRRARMERLIRQQADEILAVANEVVATQEAIAELAKSIKAVADARPVPMSAERRAALSRWAKDNPSGTTRARDT